MSHKAGLAGGILLAVGMVFARVGDNCASVGLRSARHADDLGLARSAARHVPGDAPTLARAGAGVDDPARLAAAVEHSVGAGVHADGLGGRLLHEVGPDLGLELLDLDLDDVPEKLPPAASFGSVRCPRTIAITAAPAEWEALRGGLGVACAPILILGLVGPDLRSLQLAGRDVPLPELARECLLLGARCTFIGCRDDACITATRASLRATELRPQLAPYLQDFITRTTRQPSPPALLAQLGATDGQPSLTLARPRPSP